MDHEGDALPGAAVAAWLAATGLTVGPERAAELGRQLRRIEHALWGIPLPPDVEPWSAPAPGATPVESPPAREAAGR